MLNDVCSCTEIFGVLQIIDSFLVEARDALSIRPQTVEEIGEVNAKHAELSRRKPEIEPLFAEAERKNKLLRSVAGGGVEQVGELRTRWDKFEIMMESHQLMIKDQVYVQIEISSIIFYMLDVFNNSFLRTTA